MDYIYIGRIKNEYVEKCKVIRIDNARHEIYMESHYIQKPYFEEIF